MKTHFQCDSLSGTRNLLLNIIGKKPNDKPYVRISSTSEDGEHSISGCVRDKDLERFAVNILKSIGSKKLKHPINRNLLN